MPTELSQEHLIYMNIGARYWDASRDKFNAQQEATIRDYLQDIEKKIHDGIGLYLWGDNNTGKSYIAAVLCKLVWAKYRVTSYCVTAAELKDAWISEHPAHPGSSELMTERVEEARFLVIDDLGKEHRAASGFAENKFGALLRNRSRTGGKKTTIITANIPPDQFAGVYGKSTAQLVKEHVFVLPVKGPDMREKEAEKIRKSMKRS